MNLRDWPEYLLFFIGVGGAVLFLFGPELGVKVSANPMAYTGVGAILTYVLTRGRVLNRHVERRQKKMQSKEEDDGV